MRNASGQKRRTIRVKNERHWKKRTATQATKSVTRKSDVVVVENNGKEMYKKSVLRLQSFFLLLFGLLTFFAILVAVPDYYA